MGWKAVQQRPVGIKHDSRDHYCECRSSVTWSGFAPSFCTMKRRISNTATMCARNTRAARDTRFLCCRIMDNLHSLFIDCLELARSAMVWSLRAQTLKRVWSRIVVRCVWAPRHSPLAARRFIPN